MTLSQPGNRYLSRKKYAPRLGLVALLTCAEHIGAQVWSPTSAPSDYWLAVACSADGTRLFAASEPYVGGTGLIYISTNSGANWQPTSAPAQAWSSIRCSADGTKLIATTGGVYVSQDSGDTWRLATDSGVGGEAVASSADGSRLIVVGRGGEWEGAIYLSTNSGANWRQVDSPSANGPWMATACSADGTTLLVAGQSYVWRFGEAVISTNSGATWWTANLPADIGWTCAAASADGTTLAVGGDRGAEWSPWIYISADRGVTWNPAASPLLRWRSLASSADGTNLAATGYSDIGSVPIFVSTDAGATWASAGSPLTNWSSAACSADGAKLVAAAGAGIAAKGLIYTSQGTPTPTLKLTRSDAGVLLSWIVPSTKFVLQQTSDVAAPDWTDVTTSPVLNYANLQYEVTLPISAGPVFYRLASKYTILLMRSSTPRNKSLEPNRRRASPLGTAREFGRTIPARSAPSAAIAHLRRWHTSAT
jgi:hypothetical protein